MANIGERRTVNGLGQVYNGAEWVTDYGGTGLDVIHSDVQGYPMGGANYHDTSSPGNVSATTEFNGRGYKWDPSIGAWRINYTPVVKNIQAVPAVPSGPGTSPYTDPTTGTYNENVSPDQRIIYGQTARAMELLRNTVGQGQQTGIQRLRQQLASRGLLDSGNLGAGTSNIVNYGQNLLSQGSLAAANNEADRILGLAEQERKRQWQQADLASQQAWQRQMLELQAQLQREAQPTGFEQFLRGAGQGAGEAIPFFLMKALMAAA